jgi:hypothetical protein
VVVGSSPLGPGLPANTRPQQAVPLAERGAGIARLDLGTTTLKSTVDSAPDEVLSLDQRRKALLAEHGYEDPLTDPDRRTPAWRYGRTTSVTPPPCPADREQR